MSSWRAGCRASWCPALICLMLLLASEGCGYHTAGRAVQLPENVKTIAVPAFVNETSTYHIEQLLTSSVVREFTTRAHYHILNDPGEAADATLRGTVLSTSASPLTYNSTTGQAASVLVVVSMKVSLTDRQGKVLYQNPSYLFREGVRARSRTSARSFSARSNSNMLKSRRSTGTRCSRMASRKRLRKKASSPTKT